MQPIYLFLCVHIFFQFPFFVQTARRCDIQGTLQYNEGKSK